ncbi:MAG: translation initiation factor IF-1 [Candidatus Hodgkinia cicadicola]
MKTKELNSEKIEGGVVICSLPNAMFKVRLSDKRIIVAYISGRAKLERAQVLVGENVSVKRASANSANGRIVVRYKT